MNEHALVSILTPAYNPEFFETALLSALNQDWLNCEIIVCDDSRDDTIRTLCERYAPQASIPIRYFKNETRLGEVHNAQRCVLEAKGKYIKFLYDDDIIQPTCITRLVHALNSSPNNRLASSRRTRIDENGALLADITATAFPFACDVIINGADIIAFFTDYMINFIGEPSVVLCYREDLLSFGDELFKLNGESMPFLADVALYLKLLNLGDLAFIADPLTAFRVSENQSSQLAHTDKYKAMVNKTYTTMPQVIKELGWYKGDREQNQIVKVAPMHAPEQFQEENLLQGLLQATQRSAEDFQSHILQQWLNSRVLPPQHHAWAHSFQHNRNIHHTLHIFITQAGKEAASVEATLASIRAFNGYGLSLIPVVLGKRAELAFPDVPLIEVTDGSYVQAINHYLAANNTDWVMFLDAGETVLMSGMLMFDLALDSAMGCDAVYGDEFYRSQGKLARTALRPDFNLDLLLSYPSAMARHWIFRAGTVLALDGFNPRYTQAWQFEFIVRLIEQKGIQFAGHLSEPFVIGEQPMLSNQPEEIEILAAHLRTRGYLQGEVEMPHPGLYALRYHHQEQPLVSIIIPTKDQLAVLIPCVTSLLEKTRYRNYELIIVDNNSETPEAQQWLEGISTIDPQRIRVLRYPYPFNYSAINNMAAREANGDYLVLLNNDTAIISDSWLDHLLNHGLRPEVGIVGAKLLYPTGKVQHAGVVLGLRGPADHPFIGSDNDIGGYMNRLQVDQNYNVVTAACLLIRKSVYEQVGGLDEQNFTVSYNDVDLCLKAREAGYLTVWTPHAVVMHEGSVSQKKVDKSTQEKKRQRFMAEQDTMYQKWLPIIANDPAYNPNLSLEDAGFKFVADGKNTWQPLHWKPMPTVMTFPLRSHPASQQRLAWPLERMRTEALVDGQINYHASTYAEIARYAPTSLVIQQQISPFMQEWLHRLRRISPVFTVFDLDEYLPALPASATSREKLPPDILNALRGTLNNVDRLVVASDAIAETCRGLHSDIRVVETRLYPTLWSGLTSQRAASSKPRIGWVGDANNKDDLDLIHKLISQMANRVEWIFLGYCPPSLRAWVTEFHVSVRPEHYPQKLASLNLDLALVPMADNAWNRHQSAIRLFEYGACGVPIICSDIVSLRNHLAVTRVENRYKCWRDALEMHLSDWQAAGKLGDELKKQVYETGMLEAGNLLHHARCWLPD
ncbi:glycosyltransferase [Pseudescherichia sp.]|uniref:glycosyltransferase n=1 Tax=Pseudescherichia sp. TaxID=2055881 RepID=UPI0028A14873|nr:glycosyltransferase [Pseudescherichia sp.]